MPTTLPKFLPINKVRQTKNDLFASLTPFEVELLDTIAHGGSVFGGNNSPRIVVSPSHGRDKNQKVVDEGMTEVRALVRAGWLRFADVLNQGAGWYWMTPSAERVWSVLGR